MQSPPVKLRADELGIPCIQPKTLRDEEVQKLLASYGADVFVVVAYGKILPKEVLDIPPMGCINVHGSLLPEYRGAAPMQRAIIDGKKVTGITTMFMAKGMDTGDMLLKAEVEIAPTDNFEDLHDKMAVIGADLLLETIDGLEAGTIERIPQDDALATHAPMLFKETGHIDWTMEGQRIIDLMRGMYPGHGAYAVFEEEPLKMFWAEKEDKEYPEAAYGEIVEVTKKDFAVKCGDGILRIKEVQARGGKKMAADAYLRGHAMETGVLLK
jgi:methionyl-tRNA formyltransferase